MTHRIVVLGAGYAGLVAAARIGRGLPRGRDDVRVTLVNVADRFVERVRLHQLAAGQELPLLPLTDLLAGSGVELVVARVSGIDVERRTVQLDGDSLRLEYDTLVYALGSTADVGAVPGVAEYCDTVAEAPDALRTRSRVAEVAAAGGLVTVVGGGATGLETATELAETYAGLRLRLVTDGGLGDGLSRRGRRHLRDTFTRMNIEVERGTIVEEVRGEARLTRDGRKLGTDAVVWTTGFRVPPVAEVAGLAVDAAGRMLVDETLRSVSHPSVYGVGDAAAARVKDGQVARMSCQVALPMGWQLAEVVLARLAGRVPSPPRFWYVWTNISLGRRDALTQFAHADDSPRNTVLTGRPAASFKELIVRGTIVAMRHTGPFRPAAARV